ncbi:SpoIIE family protein phosphatase [bacterium]|nr:SpoIIE family protein phosphatase [bacterium]
MPKPPSSASKSEQELLRENQRLVEALARAEAEIEAGLASVTELYEELATLYRLGETFAHTTDRDKIIGQILTLAADTIGCDGAVALLAPPAREEDEGAARFVAGPCRGVPVPSEPVILGAEDTLLSRALGQAPALIVNDWSEDERLNCPLCRSLGMERVLVARFGDASAPGLFILGRRAGADIFTAGNAKLLTSLAGALSNVLENDRLRRQELEQQRTEQQLEIARNMQMMLLPKSAPAHPLLHAAGTSTMARHVGGDYYHFHTFPDGRYGLMIADVSGKGVPAALLMTMLKGVLTGLPLDFLSPGETLSRLNSVMYREGLSDRFVTRAYVICDADRQQIVYASAGHEPILHLAAKTGKVRGLKSADFPLGLVPDLDPVDQKGPFRPGDSLVLYTDGVIEARNAAAEFFEMSRLLALLEHPPDRSAPGLIAAIQGAVAEFVGDEEQFDDLTIVALHFAAGEKA